MKIQRKTAWLIPMLASVAPAGLSNGKRLALAETGRGMPGCQKEVSSRLPSREEEAAGITVLLMDRVNTTVGDQTEVRGQSRHYLETTAPESDWHCIH